MGQEWPEPPRRKGSFHHPHQRKSRKGAGKSSSSVHGEVRILVVGLALSVVSVIGFVVFMLVSGYAA